MDLRAQESTAGPRQDRSPTPGARRPSLGRRLATRLRRQHEEDGVFRPVRLPLWIDLAISAAIVALATGAFVGFFTWLARTQ